MKTIIICLIFILLPSLLVAEILILKDGTEINTNHYWKEDRHTTGYFHDGTTKYVKTDLVDWDATKALKGKTIGTPVRPKKTKKNSEKQAPYHKEYSGSGDDVIKFSKPKDNGPALLVVSSNRANRYFSITGYSDSGARTGIFVNTTKKYDGKVLVDVLDRMMTSRLEIKAVGPWVIYVYELKYAKKYSPPGDITGNGDDVNLTN